MTSSLRMPSMIAIVLVGLAGLVSSCGWGDRPHVVQNERFLKELSRHVPAEYVESVQKCLNWANHPAGLARELARPLYEAQEQRRSESWAAKVGWQIFYQDFGSLHSVAPLPGSADPAKWREGFYIVVRLHPAPAEYSVMEGLPQIPKVVLEFVPAETATNTPYRVAWRPEGR